MLHSYTSNSQERDDLPLKPHRTAHALFTDIDHIIITSAFIAAIQAGRVRVTGISISDLENMTPHDLMGVLIKGRGDDTLHGTFTW